MSPDQRWLIIRTGGNQRFIFGSNKRRLNVGASRLVTLLPEWVRSATASHRGHVEEVVVVSGVAQLLVDDSDVARDIVEAVTRRALREAPGLEVWGWFEEEPPDLPLAQRLKVALRRHEQHRALLAPVETRNPGIAFSERCAVTSEPAAFRKGGVGFGDEHLHLSPTCHRQADAAHDALEAIRDLLGEDLETAVLAAENLDKDIENAGWVAVVHADGNGFGQMLANLGEEFPDDAEYRSVLGALSRELDEVARKSLVRAVSEVQARPRPSGQARTEWILPLIVGGDDLTAVVDAGCVRTFAEAYLRAFEECSRDGETVSRVAHAVLGTDHLTACAGVAIVKPTHPFSQAYDLAEALCLSAKRVKAISARHVSAYDVQVVHEAAGRGLADIRAVDAADGAEVPALDQGPFVTSDLAEPGSGSEAGGVDQDGDEWLREHAASLLGRAVDDLVDGLLSRSAAHDVRTALVEGPESFLRRRDALVARFVLAPARDDGDGRGLGDAATVRAWLDDHASARGLTALDLWDVETAIAEREREALA